MNSVAGIRTRYVMASETAWQVGHKAALIPTWIATMIAAVLAVLSLVMASSTVTQGILIGVAILSLIVGVGVGAFLANRAALAQIAREHEHDR